MTILTALALNGALNLALVVAYMIVASRRRTAVDIRTDGMVQ